MNPSALIASLSLILALLAFAPRAAEAAVTATGGNYTNDIPGYRIHVFTNSATASNFVVTAASPGDTVEVLVVAGGGGGGRFAGGGGAGGLIYTNAFAVAAGSNYTVTVGAGGAGSTVNYTVGANGSNSVFGSLTAYGGGGGGSRLQANPYHGQNGTGGGSGGGGSPADAAPQGMGGAGTNGQGRTGGNGGNWGWGGGGGGGAGAQGANASGNDAGKGGDGLAYSISGPIAYYAGGGGGGTYYNGGGPGTAAAGGLGGGGAGQKNADGSPGTANTGGGGGGGAHDASSPRNGGNGGSGIVIVRYAVENAWTYFMPITFTNDARLNTHTNFPALIVLDTNKVDYSQFQANGQDLRFMDSNGAELRYEVEKWMEPGGASNSYVWVQIPTLTQGCVITAYWGNASATLPAYRTDGTVWSEGYAGVWHMQATNVPNSTAAALNPSLCTANTNAAGRIDGAQGFNGSSSWLRILDSSSPTVYTLSAWICPAATASGTIIRRTDSGEAGSYSHQLRLSANKAVHYLSDGAAKTVTGTTTLTPGAWYHVVGTAINSSSMRLYVNGAEEGTAATIGTMWASGDRWNVGKNNPDYFNGLMDNLTYSKVARSANWIWAEYANMAQPAAFASCGLVEVTLPDFEAPADVSGLGAASGQHKQVTLTWTNTNTNDFKGVLILRKQDSAPTGVPVNTNTYTAGEAIGDGVVAYVGTGSSGTPGAASEWTQEGLTNGTHYYFKVFAYDRKPNYAGGVVADATPAADTTAPGPVTGLAAAGGVRQIALTWTNPADADFDGVLVVLKAGSAPTGTPAPEATYTNGQALGDGTVGYVGRGASGTPGAASGATLTGLDPATRYYVKVFAYDEAPNYAGVGADAYTAVENVKFVDVNVVGGANNGATWADAFRSLTNALANTGSGTNLWVARGTYAEGATIAMKSGVNLYGGFTNGTRAFAERDWNVNPAILDGQGARTVINGENNARLDGFTIANGVSGNGGGLYNSAKSPTVANCTFVNNMATSYGGAVYNLNAAPALANCTFASNSADRGAAVYNDGDAADVTADNCVFRENAATTYGGAMSSYQGDPAIRNCQFVRNRVTAGHGGALRSDNASFLSVYDSTFVSNSVNGYAGAIRMEGTGNGITMTNCTFRENSAAYAGAMYGYAAQVSVSNCTFVRNSSTFEGGAVYNDNVCAGTIVDSTFIGNQAGSSGGAVYGRAVPKVPFVRCTFARNTALAYHGGAYVSSAGSDSSLDLFQDCTFSGNRAADQGGAIYGDSGVATRMLSCRFAGNEAGVHGGVLANWNAANPVIENCLMVGNRASAYGGALFFVNGYGGGAKRVFHSTFAGNQAGQYGGAIAGGDGYAYVTNCILWGNSALTAGNEIYEQVTSRVRIGYSDVQGGFAGTSISNANPLFVVAKTGAWDVVSSYDIESGQTVFTDNDATWVANAYAGYLVNPQSGQTLEFVIASNSATRLYVWGDAAHDMFGATIAVAGSPYRISRYTTAAASCAVNNGLNTLGVTNDLAGVARPQGAGYDMGAYEYAADAAAPGNVSGLSATPLDQRIALAWVNPSDLDLDGVLVTRKVGADPAGTPVAGTSYTTSDTIGGDPVVFVGLASAWTNTALTAGTDYHYKFYTFDTVRNYSAGVTVNATPLSDTTAPADVSGLSAAGGLEQVTLAWTNSADADFDGVLILRRTGAAPTGTPVAGASYTAGQTLGNGTVVHAGTAASATPGAANSFTNTGLADATAYYYKVFAYDPSRNYAAGASANATTLTDTFAPGAVSNVTATGGDGQVALGWANPGDADLAGVLVLRKAGSAPTGTPSAGVTYTVGQALGDGTVAFAGSGTGCTDTGLSNGTTYYYTLFAYDNMPNYATAASASATPAAPSNILYVDLAATGANNGATWANAYSNLATALTAATYGKALWVATGTYTNNTDPAFTMKTGVNMYGGFTSGMTSLGQRDWTANPTILDGLGGRRVVGGANNARLDGFAIANGYASGHGGGMTNQNVSPVVANCTFVNNTSTSYGGAMYNFNGAPALSGCTFASNSANWGAAVYNDGDFADVTADNCVFRENTATTYGGAMSSYQGDPVIRNCQFVRNRVTAGNGGALRSDNACFTEIYDSTFVSNSVNGYAGAITMEGTGNGITMANCTFRENSAATAGAMYGYAARVSVRNCAFVRNSSANDGGAIYNDNVCAGSVEDSTFIGNQAGSSGGAVYGRAVPKVPFVRCTFARNAAVSGVGGAYVSSAGSDSFLDRFQDCTFSGNRAGQHGGVIYGDSSVATRMLNCRFTGNEAGVHGGVLANFNAANPVLENCAMIGNKAGQYGGALFFHNTLGGGAKRVFHSTFAGNQAGFYGGAIAGGNGYTYVTNCILWGNSAATAGNEIHEQVANRVLVGYSDVQGGFAGTSISNANPQFVVAETGAWDVVSSYDIESGQTVFTDNDATWVVNAYAGYMVNPQSGQTLEFTIASNSATRLYVWGEAARDMFGATIAAAGSPYRISRYATAGASCAVDNALNLGYRSDLTGAPRPQGAGPDMGAIEYASDVTAPGDVSGLTATPLNLRIALAWVNPSDLDLDGVLVTRKVGSDPAGTPATGASYTTNSTIGGDPVVFVGMADAWTNTALTAGTDYHYKFYTFDAVKNYSAGVTVNATPLADTTAPANVSGLSAAGGLEKVTLAWTNSADADFDGVLILRRTGAAPTGTPVAGTSYTAGQALGNGTVVHAGTAASATPGAANSFTNTGLADATAYYYKVFAYDPSRNYAAGASANATTLTDTFAPGAASNVTATAGDAQVALAWANPGDADLAGVLVLRKAGSAPTGTPAAGVTYTVGQVLGDGTVAFAGSGTACTDTGLSNGTTYYYTLFAYDEVPNYATAASASATPATPSNILYVDVAATGANNGTSWASAYTNLATALTAATYGKAIWVATGTYTNNTNPAFTMKANVNLYGGFTSGMTSVSQRDWNVNPTILDGQGGRRVVGGANNARLDGFTIANGYASGNGGGMTNQNVSPVVANCTFVNNTATTYGGAMYNLNGAPALSGCTFTSNSADRGAAVYNDGDSADVTADNCVFRDNTATTYGGAMSSYQGDPVIRNCQFIRNRVTAGHGGALRSDNACFTEVYDSTFVSNSVNGTGGAILLENTGNGITMANCTFRENSAATAGAMYGYAARVSVRNSAFVRNSAVGDGGAIYNDNVCSGSVEDSTFIGNQAGTGGGAVYGRCYPKVPFARCTFARNAVVSGVGGAYVSTSGSDSSLDLFQDCTFSGNRASDRGGVIYGDTAVATRMVNCRFAGNEAGNHGGVLANVNNVNPVFENCLIVGNKASGYGGALFLQSSGWNTGLKRVFHCTFAGNRALQYGGAIAGGDGYAYVTNCILWGNSAATAGNELYEQVASRIKIGYSDVQGGFAGGTAISNANPQFVVAETGTWDVVGGYDALSGQTIFTDNDAAWVVNAYAGYMVNPASGQTLEFVIASNSATRLYVWGDAARDMFGATLAAAGSPYRISRYDTAGASCAVDNGLNLGYGADLVGASRPQGAGPDMGAFEYASDVTAPGDVSDLTATPLNLRIALAWVNPSNLDLDGVLVTRKVGSDPAGTPATGASYTTNDTIGGDAVVFVGLASAWTNTALAAGTDYHYKFYTFDFVKNYSAGVTVNATPLADTTAPANVSGLSAAGGLEKVTLAWTNSADADFDGVLILRRTGAAPTGAPATGASYTAGQALGNGTVVHAGTAASATPGAANSFTNTGLADATAYYYKVFAYDPSRNYAAGASANATTLTDTFAPGAVSNVTAMSGDGQVALGWANPGDADLAGVLVLRKAGSAPTGTPSAGVSYTAGQALGDGTVAFAGSGTGCTDSGLVNGTTYHYTLFAYDEVPNYATAASASATPATPSNILYVDLAATGANNGTTWANAYTNLATALTAATYGKTLWVATGTYTNNTDPAFTMKAGVNLYGGFTSGMTSVGQRDWTANPTILDGQGARRVLFGENNARLDGFTIANGYILNNHGAGLYNNVKSPTVANCTFVNNTAAGTGVGGAMYNLNGAPALTGSTFASNSANYGGAVYNDGDLADVTADNCVFRENTAMTYGGAMSSWHGDPAIRNCQFIGNRVTAGHGGALRSDLASFTEVYDSTFVSNSVSGTAGAILIDNAGGIVLANCAFRENSAQTAGAMYGNAARVSVRNCAFVRNSAANECGAIYNENACVGSVEDSTFIGNQAGWSGGAVWGRNYPKVSFQRCTFARNAALIYNGGAYVNSGGGDLNLEVFQDCLFSGNRAGQYGGVFYGDTALATRMLNCRFAGNEAGVHGGVMVNWNAANPIFENCALIGNRAGQYGGAFFLYNANGAGIKRVYHCTFAGNQAGQYGGAIAGGTGYAYVTNSILWGDAATISGNEIYEQTANRVLVGYSDVQGGFAGTSVSNANPQFVVAETGAWDVVSSYDIESGQTVFTDNDATWVANAYAGYMVNPGTGQSLEFVIASNSATRLYVWGDAARDMYGATIAAVSSGYRISRYDTTAASCAVDNGTNLGIGSDLAGAPRPQGAGYDMGAFEYASDVTAPGDVSDLTATPLNERVALAWVNPADLDFDGVLVTRKVGSEPAGTPVAETTYTTSDSIGGDPVVFVGTATAWTNIGLIAGTDYHYKLYAYDLARNYAGGVTANATPFSDTTAPADVSGLSAAGGLEKVTLDWTNSADADFDGVLILRKTGSAPTGAPAAGASYTAGQALGDGTVAYAGAAANATPGAANSFTNSGLADATAYYYKVFAYDPSRNYAAGASANATTLTDNVAPGDVTGVTATAGDGQVGLTWTNPGDADLTGVLVLRRAGSAPTGTPSAGVTYTAGQALGDGTVAFAGSGTGCTDSGLANGTTYYYKLFAYDNVPNYATGVSTSATPQTPSNILYVDYAAAGGGNGSSWALAYQKVSDALTAATAGKVIWVAKGTYSHTAAFTMKAGVNLYGGFTSGMTSLGQRDWNANPTLLDGQGARQVISGANAWLDGFVITNGAAANGGGLYNNGVSPTVANCTFDNNRATAGSGGAVYNTGDGADPVFTNCVFRNNTATSYGGVMYTYQGDPVIWNSRFIKNTSTSVGGCFYNDNASALAVYGSSFMSNSASGGGAHGGVLYMYNTGNSLTLEDCSFTNNTAASEAGVGYLHTVQVSIKRCRFVRNTSVSNGGVFRNENACSGAMEDCEFIGNRATSGVGGAIFAFNQPKISYRRCEFVGNSNGSGADGGAIYMDAGSLLGEAFEDCLFAANRSGRYGGAMRGGTIGTQFKRCFFAANESANLGGAVYLVTGDYSRWENSVFAGNVASATGGGAIWLDGGATGIKALFNCTFAGNRATGSGGALTAGGGYVLATNCVFWGDTASVSGNEIHQQTANRALVGYSIVQGGFAGTSNLTTNPQFPTNGGAWEAVGAYNADAGQTALTDNDASWTVNEHAGKTVNPDTTQYLQYYVASNSATTLYVWGDAVTNRAGGTVANVGDTYLITSYLQPMASPALDSGAEVGVTDDICGTARPQGSGPDLGAYELAIPQAAVTLVTVPAGLKVSADGVTNTAPRVYTWYSNSVHTIGVPSPQDVDARRYVFSAWSDGGAQSHSHSVTGAVTLTASFTTQYLWQVTINPVGAGTVTPPTGWYDKGTTFNACAYPDAGNGWEFDSWSGDLTGITTNLDGVVINGPVSVTANFRQRVSVTLATTPAGLAVVADGVTNTAPFATNWYVNSVHTIGTLSPQTNGATRYLFGAWSDGGAQSHSYTVTGAGTVTASFTTQYLWQVAINPVGVGTATPTTAWYNPGATFNACAYPNPGWVFGSWSGDLTGTTTNLDGVVMNGPVSVMANFVSLGLDFPGTVFKFR